MKTLKYIVPVGLVFIGLAGLGLFSVYGQASSTPVSVKDKAHVSSSDMSGYSLPGGASSLNETYQDWRVVCQKGTAATQCVVVQQVSENKTHQHILTIELQPQNGKAVGFATLPFGLALAKGAALQADTQPVVAAQPFTTCVPAGCIVPVSLSKQQLTQIQSAKKVELHAYAITGQDVAIPFSNKGLEQAMARIVALYGAGAALK